MTDTCDHIVGIDCTDNCASFNMSMREELGRARCAQFKAHFSALTPEVQLILAHKKDWTPDDFWWNEYVEYKFCPECGARITRPTDPSDRAIVATG